MPIDPRMIQALIGMGADLSAYGGNTDKGFQPTNLNAATAQSISSGSMLKLIKQALGPDNLNIKASNKGLTVNIPNEAEQLSGPGMGEASTAEGVVPTESSAPTRAGAPNPFANLDASSLAGLSPQDIMSVFSAKHAQDTLKQQSYRDMVEALYKGNVVGQKEQELAADIPYKRALTKQSEATTAENTATVDIAYGDKTFKVTPKDAIAWEKMKKETTPNEVKLYEYAKGQGFAGSIVDFKNADQTGHKKDYDEAVKSGYKGGFSTWMLDMAKAGAINLGTKVEEKKTLSELGGQLYFNDPKWTADLHKGIEEFKTKDLWNVLDEKDRPLAISKERVKFVEGKIAAGSGAIQSVVMDKDGKTMVWTVKWPSGDTKTIRQAVR